MGGDQWRHDSGPRPTLVVVHGFGASPAWFNIAFFALRGLSALPSEQVRPNALQRNSFRANVQATLAPQLTMQVASGYINSLTRFPQNEDNRNGLMVNAMGANWRTDQVDPAGNPLLGARSWSAGEVFSRTAQQGINRFINSLSAQYAPAGWLTARANFGYDLTARADKAYNRVNEGPYSGQDRLGQVSNFRTEQGQRTVDVGGTATLNVLRRVQTKTSVGMQYIKNLTVQTGATGQTLPPGALTVTQAAVRSSSEQTIDRRTLGYYAEEVVSYGDELFLNLGVRPLQFEEPRRVLVALEMAVRGNAVVPTTNGALYFNKPPLYNWLLLACTRLFGSWPRHASSTESEIWSAILSGWPSVTDSEVKRCSPSASFSWVMRPGSPSTVNESLNSDRED